MIDTLQTLMDTAESDVRLRGYHAASFRDLAEDLGIKISSVHYYFRQKEDLGLALVERYAARFFAALAQQTTMTETPDERVRALCKLYRHALVGSDSICLCVMLGTESSGLPDALSDAVAGFSQTNVDWLSEALPKTLTPRQRQKRAARIVATLHGAMVPASGLGNYKVFDNAVQDLLAIQAT